MGRTCCAPGCRTGYASAPKKDPTVSLHTFPKDEARLQQWLKAIPRADWKPTASSLICSLHFTLADFVQESQDSNLHRSSRLDPLKKKYLTSTAVPSIFPNVPKYLSNPPPPPRSEETGSTARFQRQVLVQEEINTAFLDNDVIKNVGDLKANLDRACLPKEVEALFRHDKAIFSHIELDSTGRPIISSSLIVHVSISSTLVFLPTICLTIDITIYY